MEISLYSVSLSTAIFLLRILILSVIQISTFLKLVLPVGISFYTFQTMSYTIDVYRKKVSAQKNIINFAAYVTMFPQLVAGPIVRYKTIAKQLNKKTGNDKWICIWHTAFYYWFI